MNESFLEIRTYDGQGYQPLVNTPGWRVALLNDRPEGYRRETLTYLERHMETDEVFVLLSGRCTLLIGDGTGSAPGTISAVEMEPRKLYNVKKGVWHNLLGTPEMTLLIVKNADTTKENSQYYRGVTPDMLP